MPGFAQAAAGRTMLRVVNGTRWCAYGAWPAGKDLRALLTNPGPRFSLTRRPMRALAASFVSQQTLPVFNFREDTQ